MFYVKQNGVCKSLDGCKSLDILLNMSKKYRYSYKAMSKKLERKLNVVEFVRMYTEGL